MRVNEQETAAKLIELTLDGPEAQAWELSGQVPVTEIPRFREMLRRQEPVRLRFHRREVERVGPGVEREVTAEVAGDAVLEAFPHTSAGGSARFTT